MGSGASVEKVEDELKYSSTIDYDLLCKLSNENGVTEDERELFYSKHKKPDGLIDRGDLIFAINTVRAPANNAISDVLPPIRFIDFNKFKDHGTFPRYPEQKDLITNLEDISREKSFLVFISHCWLRGWAGAEGYDGRPHPDTADGVKFQLCVKGIEKAFKSLAPAMTECFVWLDFGCIDQNGDPAGELKQLDQIVASSDCIFTPIHDTEVWELPRVVKDMYAEYKAKLWLDGPHAYINRGWCRVEMMYAATIPLLQGDNDENSSNNKNLLIEKQRLRNFSAGLHFHASNGRRPHLLFGTNEMRRNTDPIILPPLQNSYFTHYNPLDGSLSVESDRQHISTLIAKLEPYIKKQQEGYKGQTNSQGQYHGKGEYRFASGDVYRGEWSNGLKQGQGMYRFASGAVYVGHFMLNKMDGHGVYTFASGVYYDGEFKEGKKQGTGTYYYSSGDVYTGLWRHDQKNGKGVYRYASGDVYTGEFHDDAKHGHGVLEYVDKSCYDGEWKDDKKHGKGTFKFANGDIYTGSYKNGEKHGKGKYQVKGEEAVDGEWEHGVRQAKHPANKDGDHHHHKKH